LDFIQVINMVSLSRDVAGGAVIVREAGGVVFDP
jgi:fructose-1,6-bisphosphatase/inositol monophosphatase family enzyme